MSYCIDQQGDKYVVVNEKTDTEVAVLPTEKQAVDYIKELERS